MPVPSSAWVIDTNVLIYYLNQQLPASAKAHVDRAFLSRCAVSVITRIEVLSWQGHTEESVRAAKGLLSLCEEISLNKAIADRCIELRRSYKIRLPDAIIAATALISNNKLMSRNSDDFVKVDGLECFNPFS